MGLNTYTLDFMELSIDPKIGLKDYSTLYKNGIRLKLFLLNKNIKTDIKSGRTPSRFKEEYWNGNNEFLTMSDVDKFTFSINSECTDKITDFAVEEEKTLHQVKKDSLIISNAMTLGLSFLTNRDVYINQNVFEVKLDETKVNKKFVLWYFNLVIKPLFQKTYASKYLSKEELGRINIPLISKEKQDKIITKIKPIEKKIRELKLHIKETQEIINEVFARRFRFDKDLYNEFGKGMTTGTQIVQNRKLRVFEANFNQFSRINILRFSTRFHNPPTKKLMDFMKSVETLQVKDVITEPIHRGTSPEYDKEGTIPVIKTAHLKNGLIDISEEEFVCENFYNQKIRSQVKEYDVLWASTGKVSIGKIDLVETDEKLFVDGHISIVRIAPEKYNPLFFTYFFRSILGIFQIERDFTGATNQIELGKIEISDFKIPNIPLEEQKQIVDKIKEKLDKQDEIKQKIEAERKKIDEIIERSID